MSLRTMYLYSIILTNITQSKAVKNFPMCNDNNPSNTLVIATRLHLGHASHPPPSSQLNDTLQSFAKLAATVGAHHAVVAVDAEPKLEGYDLVSEVRKICKSLNTGENDLTPTETSNTRQCTPADIDPSPHVPLQVLPVTPWGKFVPALNAIVGWSARQGAAYLLLASAEVKMTRRVIDVLKEHMDLERTLVVGEFL